MPAAPVYNSAFYAANAAATTTTSASHHHRSSQQHLHPQQHPTSTAAVAPTSHHHHHHHHHHHQQHGNHSPITSAPTSSSSTTANTVGVHYRTGRKIGEGSFGIIYEGVNLINNQAVAIKFESRKSEAPQLKDEFRTYKIMAGQIGIPSVYFHGQEGLHNILVIDLLGPSLEDLFESCGRKFSIKTTCLLAKQMITRIQCLHEKSLIYRDIKPDNFLIGRMGTKGQNTVYIVDFGMAKYYRDPRTKQHIPYRERKSISGTARYMSINTHLGREQSRRDDLEALGHVFMYFLRGGLPWQGLKAATNKQKYEKIGEKKQSTGIRELCEGFPEEFSRYMAYVRRLAFEEQPDYEMLKSFFDDVLRKAGESEDSIYDWMSLESWIAAQPSSSSSLQVQPVKPQQLENGAILSGGGKRASATEALRHQHPLSTSISPRHSRAGAGALQGQTATSLAQRPGSGLMKHPHGHALPANGSAVPAQPPFPSISQSAAGLAPNAAEYRNTYTSQNGTTHEVSVNHHHRSPPPPIYQTSSPGLQPTGSSSSRQQIHSQSNQHLPRHHTLPGNVGLDETSGNESRKKKKANVFKRIIRGITRK